MAVDVAKKYSLPHTFNKYNKTDWKKWIYAFMRRKPHLVLRKAEGTSLARATGFTQENVWHFFDILEKVVDKNKLTSDSSIRI